MQSEGGGIFIMTETVRLIACRAYPGASCRSTAVHSATVMCNAGMQEKHMFPGICRTCGGVHQVAYLLAKLGAHALLLMKGSRVMTRTTPAVAAAPAPAPGRYVQFLAATALPQSPAAALAATAPAVNQPLMTLRGQHFMRAMPAPIRSRLRPVPLATAPVLHEVPAVSPIAAVRGWQRRAGTAPHHGRRWTRCSPWSHASC